jgi:hypothetical protein
MQIVCLIVSWANDASEQEIIQSKPQVWILMYQPILRVVRKAATLPQLKKVPVSLRMDGSSLSETMCSVWVGRRCWVGRKVTAVVAYYVHA